MARVTTYKNSKLASFFSILGYLFIVGGVYCCFNDELVAGIVVLVLGFGLKLLAAFISKKKSEKAAKRSQIL